MTTNRAAILTGKQVRPFKVDEWPSHEPGPQEIVLRNHAVAINPIDAMIQVMGIITESFPAIMGCDAAGEVVKVGSAVTRFKPGDRAVGLVHLNDVIKGPWDQGTFQLYFKTTESIAAKIPEGISYAEASVLPLGLSTAGGGLFESNGMALSLPQPGGSKPNGKHIVIWAASTSVGTCAIQLARAAGYEVTATAGAHNQDYCRSLGAKHVFDYKSETVVDDIAAALKGEDSAGVFACRFEPETLVACAELVQKLGGKQTVGTVLAPGMPIPESIPKSVEMPTNAGIQDKKIEEAIWAHWLSGALADGSMKCKPDPQIVGKGLETIQEACDLMVKGVSASKLVVEL